MKSSLESPEDVSIRLHSAKQVAGAAALGGPVAGVWLLTRNRTRLALGSGIRYVTYVTIGTMLLFHLVVSVFPTDFPVEVGPFLSGAVFWGLFRYSLRDKYDEFITTGGKKASIWRAAMITLVSIPLSLAGLFLLETVLPIKPINHLAYPPSSVYFEGEATKADAQALGDLLLNEGLFHDEVVHHLTVQRISASSVDTSQVLIIRWRTGLAPEPGTPVWREFDNLREGIQRLIYPNDEVRIVFENAWGISSAQIPARE